MEFLRLLMSYSIYGFSAETLNPGDLATLVNELHEVTADWYDLGVQLRMEKTDLDAIKLENMKECLRRMLYLWLTKTTPSPPSWQRLVDTLSSPAINRPALAEKIKRTYCSKSLGMLSYNFLSIYTELDLESHLSLFVNISTCRCL